MPTPRQVAVALITRSRDLELTPEILVVSSRKHENRWVFPKGGIEAGESPSQAAERESWEEAGVKTTVLSHHSHLTTLPDAKPHKNSRSLLPSAGSSFTPSTEYHFEIFQVGTDGSVLSDSEVLSEDFPEKHERVRKWIGDWEELRETVGWGRRGELMLAVVDQLKNVKL
ncbi:hypothetical protein T439DRAFT_320097 [Meredithblackwellia eburnea MCA 4105]